MHRDSAALQRDLVKLVRLVAGREATVCENGGGGVVLVSRKGEAGRSFPLAVLGEACALGLLVKTGPSLQATPQAAAFLRRAMLSPDDRFQDQHREIEKRSVLVDEVRQPVRVNLCESPLGGMARLKEKSGAPFLSAAALDAGLRLHADLPAPSCSRN